ncbi:hypothetical protein Q5M85_14650 [Paraclostridium bifermentans]|nr:hypothetical protein [Paraclostridium bifermentans]
MGNEGNTDIHCSGKFTSMEEVEDVIIQIGNQENLDISVSCIGPDKISATLISPSGEYSYLFNILQMKIYIMEHLILKRLNIHLDIYTRG